MGRQAGRQADKQGRYRLAFKCSVMESLYETHIDFKNSDYVTSFYTCQY